MRFLVIVEEGPSSFGAYVSDLPGCIAVGETREEVLTLIQKAISIHLASLSNEGAAIPPQASTSVLIDVEVA